MQNSRSIKVKIHGNDYYIKSGYDEEYIKILAGLVDQTMQEIQQRTGITANPRLAILAALNIADILYKSELESQKLVELITKKLSKAIESR